MSRFLMFVCLTLGLIITGCGGEKKEDKPKDQKTTKEDEKGSAAKGSTGKKEEKGSETKKEEKAPETKKEEKGSTAKKEEKAPEAKKEEKAPEAKKEEDKKASTEKSDEVLVSLKLPNMT